MANTTQSVPGKKNNNKPAPAPVPPRPQGGSNEFSQREHEERLAREASRVKPGDPGYNEHNAREHEEKMRREGAKA